jgi:FkbM family methyltransferase
LSEPTDAKGLARLWRRLAVSSLGRLSASDRAAVLEYLVQTSETEIDVGGGALVLHTPFPGPLFRARYFHKKEPETLEWIHSFDPGDVLWDIGANVGMYSLYAAARQGVSVLAFEPAAANYNILTKNIVRNGLESRVSTYCLAVAERLALGVLNLSSEAAGAAVNQFGGPGDRSPYAAEHAPAASHGMLGVSIDDLTGRLGAAFPNHLKIDVDGLEPAIIRGGRRTLADERVKSVLIELGVAVVEDRADVVAEMKAIGFELTAQGEAQGQGSAKGVNHIFRRTRSGHALESPR